MAMGEQTKNVQKLSQIKLLQICHPMQTDNPASDQGVTEHQLHSLEQVGQFFCHGE
jgi:hypothetical protein